MIEGYRRLHYVKQKKLAKLYGIGVKVDLLSFMRTQWKYLAGNTENSELTYFY